LFYNKDFLLPDAALTSTDFNLYNSPTAVDTTVGGREYAPAGMGHAHGMPAGPSGGGHTLLGLNSAHTSSYLHEPILRPRRRVGTFGLALFTTLFCSQNTVQLMTAGMVHVTI
jgi:hypothetical protein